jgi:5-formyltetrahydrofolate cyclo-ligase
MSDALDLFKYAIGSGATQVFFRHMLPGRALVKLGICFSFQLLDAIPMEPHDIVMDAAVTDSTKSLQD